MILVTICALDHAFSDPVPFVEENLFCNFAMAAQTELVTFFCQELISAHIRMKLMTVRAGHRAFHVVTSGEEKIFVFLAMAVQALLRLLRSEDRSFEAEYCFQSSACFKMSAPFTMTGFAAFDLVALFFGEGVDGHLVVLVLLLMALLACLRPDIVFPESSLSGSKRRNNQKNSQG